MALPGKIDLNDLLVFQTVADTGGFTAAAQRLGVATGKVSVEISRLESRLGMALFHRTTRKVVLTDDGQALYEECRPLLVGLTDALERATSGERQLKGTLRISTTVDHAALSLAPILAAFASEHPGLSIDLRTSDRIVDLVEAGVDVTIRLGWLRDSSSRAVKLGEFGQFVVAAPDYLRRIAIPETPDELAKLDWITLALLPTPLAWRFTSPSGETRSVTMKSRIRVDSPGVLRTLLEQSVGISVLDQFNAQAGIAAERLVRLVPEWSLPTGGIYAVYPPGKQVPAKARRFVDFYQRYLAGQRATKKPAAPAS